MTLPAQNQTTGLELLAALAQARQGTAFFAGQLERLSNAELDGASLLPNWTRRHVVSHVAYNAKAISRLVAWAATGVETPMYPSIEVRNDEIAHGVNLGPVALRKLFRDTAEQLDADWDNLPAASWHSTVRTIQGREVPATAAVWMRSRELWVHAVDLNNGAGFDDLPDSVLARLLDDITGAWSARGADTGLAIGITDDDGTVRQLLGKAQPETGEGRGDGAVRESDPANGEATEISGTLAAVAQWASGRGTSGVTARKSSAQGAAPLSGIVTAEVPAAPAWL
ncbi:maleylpyruvate isomerase family mycothiol-dependent enzyme [Arthrobacter sp. H41]|uniref:maleylpyruvate isomerase family mycothiol-dependent enzyme n=1 Tax=Arthrobacter sp. H41 TaxID=1312978 RepID=UPI0004B6D9B4|nr:maleylpyruvate isomerase family mycothiol-dependent enzyme [Arthrobacter sp. H41]